MESSCLHLSILALSLIATSLCSDDGCDINIALRKPARQSSDAYPEYTADQAVDGINQTFSFTGHQSDKVWWMVDLKNSFYIGRINLLSSAQEGLLLRSGDQYCPIPLQTAYSIQWTSRTLTNGIVQQLFEAQYIAVVGRNSDYQNLYIHEIQVYESCSQPSNSSDGRPDCNIRSDRECSDIQQCVNGATYPGYGNNIALRKPVRQSSNTFENFLTAKWAVDGNKSTYTTTHIDAKQKWWLVDLEKSYEIARIDMVLNKSASAKNISILALAGGFEPHPLVEMYETRWVTLKTANGFDQFKTLILHPTVTAQYIAIFIDDDTQKFQLGEVEVFEEIKCADPPSVDNGEVNWTGNSWIGSNTGFYTCREGYALTDTSGIRCAVIDGKVSWSGIPQCEDADPPELVRGILITCAVLTLLSILTFCIYLVRIALRKWQEDMRVHSKSGFLFM